MKVAAITMLTLGAISLFWTTNAQPDARFIQELNRSNIIVRVVEFNPGRNSEWDNILEFRIRYGVSGFDQVARKIYSEEVGVSPQFLVLESELEANPRRFNLSGESLARAYDRTGKIKNQSLELVWVDENFFWDIDQVAAQFDISLLPWTRPIQSRIADLPRAGRKNASLGSLTVQLQRQAVRQELQDEIAPDASIRQLVEAEWAGPEMTYKPYSIKMTLLTNVLKEVDIPLTFIVEDEKLLEVLTKLMTRIELTADHQVKAEDYRVAQRYLSFGLPLIAVAKFFGWINPEDGPSGKEGMLEIAKMLAKAEYHSFQADRHLKKIPDEAVDFKEAIERSEQPALRERLKDFGLGLWDSVKSRIGKEEEEATLP